jgi:hypothetical protein
MLSKLMDVIRRASSLEQVLKGVPYKEFLYKGRRAQLNTTSILTEVMAGPKKDWTAAVERMADETYPQWRELEKQTGRRLPVDMRKEVEQRSTWNAQRRSFVGVLLDWLGAKADPEMVTEMTTRLAAAVEFTTFVAREFLVGNYSPKKHQSDVFDQFQLEYLALDRSIIVTHDPDLSKRIHRSPQAARIMSFDEFLSNLST